MSAETLRVLEMIAEGKLSIEDGNRLLQALDEPRGPQPAASRADPAPGAPRFGRVGDSMAGGSAREGAPTAPSSGPSLDELVQMCNHGVDADFIAELRAAGYRSLRPDELIRLRDHGVDADFVAELREIGFVDLPVGELIRLRDHGVDADFVSGLRAMGYANITPDAAVQLHDSGIDPEEIEELRQALAPDPSDE